MSDGKSVTQPQIDYVRGMQRRLRLPNRFLDDHCTVRFGEPFAKLTRMQVSALIEEMEAWTTLPAELQRAMGQQDLPGLET